MANVGLILAVKEAESSLTSQKKLPMVLMQMQIEDAAGPRPKRIQLIASVRYHLILLQEKITVWFSWLIGQLYILLDITNRASLVMDI